MRSAFFRIKSHESTPSLFPHYSAFSGISRHNLRLLFSSAKNPPRIFCYLCPLLLLTPAVPAALPSPEEEGASKVHNPQTFLQFTQPADICAIYKTCRSFCKLQNQQKIMQITRRPEFSAMYISCRILAIDTPN